MNKRHYEHTLPNIRGSLSNTYKSSATLCTDRRHDSLHLLKKYVHSPEQQEHIDSLCLLLENKEQLLFTAMRNLQE